MPSARAIETMATPMFRIFRCFIISISDISPEDLLLEVSSANSDGDDDDDGPLEMDTTSPNLAAEEPGRIGVTSFASVVFVRALVADESSSSAYPEVSESS